MWKTKITISSGLGRIAFRKVLEMYKTKIIKPSADAMEMMIQRELVTETGAYETVKSTTSIIDDTSANALEYRSYLLSMSVVFTLNYILGRSIFLSGGSEERRNGPLNVVNLFSLII